MNSSESAEAVVKMMLEGIEVVARITGEGAKQIAIMLYTMSKDKEKHSKGRTNLNKMLKSGIPQKIFSLRQEQLKKFHKEAKRYGILYTAITNKNSKKDGMVDLFVRAEDAPKVNHIVQKFKLEALNVAEIKSSIEREKMDKMLNEAKEKGIEIKSKEERVADDIMTKPLKKEDKEMQNPNVAKTEKNPLSEHSLENKKDIGVTSKNKKKSVRVLLKELTEELRNRSENKEKSKIKEAKQEVIKVKENNSLEHHHQKNIKKKSKNRGR